MIPSLLQGQHQTPQKEKGIAFAPANVALCKYWGKRDHHLNLPVTNSLSVSLGNYGATTTVFPIGEPQDSVFLNAQALPEKQPFVLRLTTFLEHFRESLGGHYFRIETTTNIPVSAGLASSAAGFAALTLALSDLFQWNLALSELSKIARMGSGSACRSLWQGFVEWEKGEDPEGEDSFARLLMDDWFDFKVGLLILNANEKLMSSRQAMKNTMATSLFYSKWPEKVHQDLSLLKKALQIKDFDLLGETAESNAMCMHALMHTASPPIVFGEAATFSAQSYIRQCRKEGLRVYFTQDAGPNLKLLYLEEDEPKVKQAFPNLLPVSPMQPKEYPVILVDEQDNPKGSCEKMRAHELGLLHRAFSVFVFRKYRGQVEFLLQQRHADKYHCGNLWTNTCCSHPREGENIEEAGRRRLKEEMSLDLPLSHVGSFMYRAVFPNGLIEHEFDHVLIGEYQQGMEIKADPNEVQNYQWISIESLQQALKTTPELYTPWFKPALNIALERLCQMS